ncbi:MAG: sigma-70 family RNA polymerase sigma factor [Planctomycetota bacterium]|nr:sigma-70 family RNA polymerase sigma factor [Planctomycetota bacterium]
MDDSIRQLTGAIASGDTEAFARFYRRWVDRMYGEAHRATGRDESFCLDVVHDAMLRVMKSIRPMDNEAALWGWLRVVVRSCAFDRLRREARRRKREQADAAGFPSEPRDDLAERLAWLRAELARLDERETALLTMRHRFGWTLRRIALAAGLEPGAVDGRLRRTLNTLRRRAEEAFDE